MHRVKHNEGSEMQCLLSIVSKTVVVGNNEHLRYLIT